MLASTPASILNHKSKQTGIPNRFRRSLNRSSISASTLNKYRVFGGGPVFCKVGRTVVYDPSDLDAWLASCRRVSTSDNGREAA